MRPSHAAWVTLSFVGCLAVTFGACGGDDSTPGGQPDATTPTPDGGNPVDGSLPPPDGGAEATKDMAAGEPPPSKPPYDWVGVIGTGQSLSVGATASTISTMQPFGNLKLQDNGPDPKYPITPDAGVWATVPLTEPIRTSVPGTGPGYGDGQYPDNIAGETPHSGMANTLTSTWKARGGLGDYVSIHSVVGWSGHCLTDINKEGGQRAYPASLNEARVLKALSSAAGKTLGYGGIVLTHGECDAGNAAYGAGLFQLWQDYNADLKAVTGQTADVVLLISQQSTIASGATGSAVQVWQAGVDHPGQVICTGPKYQYAYSSDNLHLPAPGYERLGEKYAEVFDVVVNQKATWKPLQPSMITRAGAVLTIDFDVPSPPLAWDPNLPAPHQQVFPEWAKGNGFEVADAGGNHLTIASVMLNATSVVLTLSAAPVGTITVGYALTQDGMGLQGGTPLGLHGLLRDSDDFVGYDAETIPAAMTNGSAVVKSTAAGAFVRRAGRDIVTGSGLPAGTIVASHDSDDQLTLSAAWTGPTGNAQLAFHHDEHNYCVHFAKTVP